MKFKGGWHGESYRHYLARKGVKTAGQKVRMYGADNLTFTKSVLAQIEKTRADKDAEDRARLQAREQSVAASVLPYADRPLTAAEQDRVRQEVNWMKLSETDRKKQIEAAVYGDGGIQSDLIKYQVLLNKDLPRDEAEKVMLDLDSSMVELSAAQRFGMTPQEYAKSRAVMEQFALTRRRWVEKYPELAKSVNAERKVALSGPDPYGLEKFKTRMSAVGEVAKSGAAKAWEKTKEVGSKAKALEEKGVAWAKEEYPVAKEWLKTKAADAKIEAEVIGLGLSTAADKTGKWISSHAPITVGEKQGVPSANIEVELPPARTGPGMTIDVESKPLPKDTSPLFPRIVRVTQVEPDVSPGFIKFTRKVDK